MNSFADPNVKIHWKNVFLFSVYHVVALNGLLHLLTSQVQWKTFVWIFFISVLSNHGITSAAYLLWSHRTYKAKLPLRIYLCFCQTIVFQKNVIVWAQEHRHFYPRNPDIVYSLMIQKHPDLVNQIATMDISDLREDPLLIFQEKYYTVLSTLCSFVAPTIIPTLFWNEKLYVAYSLAVLRYLFTLYCMKIYDGKKSVEAADWHQNGDLEYSETISSDFIGLMDKIGWAYDLEQLTENFVEKPMRKNGFELFMRELRY